jgi:hypothetical protein
MTSIHAITSADHECGPNSFCQLQIYTFLMPFLEINLTWVWLGPIAPRRWFFDMVSNVGAPWAKSICSSRTTHTSCLVRIGLKNVLCVIVTLQYAGPGGHQFDHRAMPCALNRGIDWKICQSGKIEGIRGCWWHGGPHLRKMQLKPLIWCSKPCRGSSGLMFWYIHALPSFLSWQIGCRL